MDHPEAVKRILEQAADDIMEELAPTIDVYEEMRRLLRRMVACYTLQDPHGESMIDLISEAVYLDKKLPKVTG